MAKPVKITVIGAGSATFSMGLVRDLILTENLAGSLVSFMDVNQERLDMIHRLAERYVDEMGAQLRFEKTTDQRRALAEADFVINTAGTEYGHWEESRALAKKHGYFNGGSFGVSYYNLKLMMSVARDMEQVCPNAWLIQSGNPVLEGTTLMTRQTGLKIIGLCHGHYGYHNIARALGLDPAQVTWTAPGLNHLIWLTEFRYQGKDAYPLVDEWLATKAAAYWKDREDHPSKYGLEDQMSRAVIDQYRRFGLMPVGDTTRDGGWWYKTDIDTQVYWYGPTGGFASDLHLPPFFKQHYARIDEIHAVVTDASRKVTETFPPVKTREQQVPIIDALTNDVAGTFQINVPNNGAIPGLADDLATEGAAIIDAGGIHRIQQPPLPAKIMIEVIQPRALAVEWELEAFNTGDRGMLLDGLLMVQHHQSGGHTQSHAQARAYLDDYLSQPWNREMGEYFAEKKPSWAHLVERP